jgi:DNA-binding MarR family transcriptional regulator
MTNADTLSPQVLGRAENAHRALLDRILSATDISYSRWVALTLTAVSGDDIDRELLVMRLADALKIDAEAASGVVAELTESQLLDGGQADSVRVGLTESGRARYRQIRGAVHDVLERLYDDIPADELATAGRVLTLITARANAELASA